MYNDMKWWTNLRLEVIRDEVCVREILHVRTAIGRPIRIFGCMERRHFDGLLCICVYLCKTVSTT